MHGAVRRTLRTIRRRGRESRRVARASPGPAAVLLGDPAGWSVPGPRAHPRPRPEVPYGEKETVSGISVMPLYFSIASFMRLSLWPRRLFHSAHQLRKFLKVGSASERMPK